MTATRDRDLVIALTRGLAVLRCFSSGRDLSVAEIVRMTGLKQPTAWRMCRTLLAMGMVERVGSSDRVRAGLPSLLLGEALLARLDILTVLQPHMDDLEAEFDCAVSLAFPDALDMIMIARLQGRAVFVTETRVGSRVQMGRSSLGWAWLAGLPGEQRQATEARIAEADPDWPAAGCEQAIARYRRDGFVLAIGVLQPEVNAAAVPLATEPPLALSCGGHGRLLTEERLQQVGQRLRAVAETATHPPVMSNPSTLVSSLEPGRCR